MEVVAAGSRKEQEEGKVEDLKLRFSVALVWRALELVDAGRLLFLHLLPPLPLPLLGGISGPAPP